LEENKRDKHFLSNYQVEEVERDKFKILFDSDTKDAGADNAIIDKTWISIECDDYKICIEHNLDSVDLNQKILYALRRKEDNPRIIRQILKHLEELRSIIDLIFFYFSKQRLQH
jgi:hypothetical protein